MPCSQVEKGELVGSQASNNKYVSSLFCSIVQTSAQVKIEENFEEIFEDRESSANGHNYLSVDRYSESLSGDSNSGQGSVETRSIAPITPIKVEVFKFKDFEKMGMESFLRQIQPGVMDATGQFKKVDRLVAGEEWRARK
jgi:hypothetical protein